VVRQIWIDQTSIPAAVDWRDSIQKGIEHANVCVYCLSNDSITSEVCNWELDHMLKHSKRIIPIVVRENFQWDEVHAEVARLNFIFFSNPDDVFADQFHKLREAIETDHAYLELHTRFNMYAIDWDERGRDPSIVLRGPYLRILAEFESQAETMEPGPSDIMEDFFTESKVEALKAEREANLLDALLHDDPSNDSAEKDVVKIWQGQVQRVLSNPYVQMVTLCLIMLDFAFGIASLLVSLSDKDKFRDLEKLFLFVAVTLLTLFEIEILLQWFSLGTTRFLHHPGFMFDFIIVTASLVLELGRVGNDTWLDPSILIILRAWRVARLLNVAKLGLRNEVRQLKEDLLIERGRVNKFKRLVKHMQRNEEMMNRRYLTMRKDLRLSSKNLRVMDSSMDVSQGGETFREREQHIHELLNSSCSSRASSRESIPSTPGHRRIMSG